MNTTPLPETVASASFVHGFTWPFACACVTISDRPYARAGQTFALLNALVNK